MKQMSLWSVALLLAWAAEVEAQPYGEPPPPPPDAQAYPEGEPYVEGEAAAEAGVYAEPPPAGGDSGELRVVEQGSAEGQAMTAHGRGIETGGHIVFPVLLSTNDARGGIGLQGRLGFAFSRGWSVELNVGVFGAGWDDPLYDGISNLWLGGGLRYSFLNPSAFVPFIGAGLALNFWTPCVDTGFEVICDGETDPSVSVNGLIGAAYELTPFIAVEAGLSVNVTGETDYVLLERTVWIAPFIGGTFYY